MHKVAFFSFNLSANYFGYTTSMNPYILWSATTIILQLENKTVSEDMKWLIRWAVDEIGLACTQNSSPPPHALFYVSSTWGLGSKDLWMRARSYGLAGKGAWLKSQSKAALKGWILDNLIDSTSTSWGLSECESLKKWRWIIRSPYLQESHGLGKKQIHLKLFNHNLRCTWEVQKNGARIPTMN